MNFADPSGLNRLMCDVYTDYGCAASGNHGTSGVGWYMYTTYTYGPEGTSVSGGGGFFPGSPGGGGDRIGGGGGTAAPALNRDLLDAAVKRAKEALSENENCQKLFGNAKMRANGFDPSSVLDEIAAGTLGTLTFEGKGANWGAAGVSPNGVPKLSSVTITINSYNDGTHAYWNLGNTDYNAETLLHELGHVYDLTKGSGNSILKTPDDIPIIGSKRSAWNDWRVDQDCFHGALGYKKP